MSSISTIGVVGAGQMGAGIAQVCATAGYTTMLWDANPDALAKGMGFIDKMLTRAVEKGKLTSEHADTARANLSAIKSSTEFAPCDLVIEAIVENFDIKAKLFQDLDAILAPEAILSSNTSSISITKLAATTKRPDQVIGLHFMNPVPIMELVEIIRGLQTSNHTYSLCKNTMQKLGKTTVLGVDSAGFVVNRILCPMINEAIYLLQEGVKAEDIDNAMVLGTNQPMGPLTLADFVGLDTLLYILRILHSELGEDKYRPCPLLVKYVEAGWFGRKSGRGFYDYNE
jgi:3-hydroxybutyryl-CoA dehydrogenase